MDKKTVREVFYYRDYYLDFFEKQNPKVKQKLNWTLQLIETIERVPEKYFKHLTGTSGLYEVRVEVGSDTYRIFCFFDREKLIILINGFQKKTQRTPANEIVLAEKLKKQYFYDRNN